MSDPVKFTEDQWDCLRDWIRAEARAAVADDRPAHNRLTAECSETKFEENMARMEFGLEKMNE